MQSDSDAPTDLAAIDPTIARIRVEGIEHSQVMATLDYLCNAIGPRLTGSERLREANEWTRQRLEAWGLANAHLEPWGPFGRAWTVRRFSLQVIEPYQFNLIGYPRAWSPGLPQSTTAPVVFLDARSEDELEPFKGTLKGKVVLVGQPRAVEPRFLPLAGRKTDEELARLAQAKAGESGSALAPGLDSATERRSRFRASNGQIEALLSRGQSATTTATTSPASQPATTRSSAADTFTSRLLRFAQDEGAALTLLPSTIGDGGTTFVTSAVVPPPAGTTQPTTMPRAFALDAPPIPPQVTLAVEDYNRLARGSRLGEHFTVSADMDVELGDKAQPVFNTIAEIPGSDLKQQVVMVGAHLDCWQAGTGATDNGAGVACAMEAVRILRALDLHPRRTIRIGLWTGEEEGLLGSAAYVAQHFGTPTTRPVPTVQPTTQTGTTRHADPATEPETTHTPGDSKAAQIAAEYGDLSVYFNLDNGAGRIRGIYAQGDRAALPLFTRWIEPFHDLGASTVTLADTGGTDHLSFDAIGLPGFQFIQDPIEYSTRTHHSNEDVYDRLPADDLKQASTVLAAFVWQAAMADERFPRKPSAR